MAKQAFIINDLLEITETPSIKAPFSLHKAVNNNQYTSILQLFSVAIDPLKENDAYYDNFKIFVSGLEKLAEEPQSNIPVLLSYGVTETGSYPFIEMACIDGESVNRYLSTHKFLGIDQIVQLTKALSRTLAHCHNLDLVHGIISDKYIIHSSKEDKYILTGFGLSVFTTEMRQRFIETITKDCLATEVKTGVLLPQTDIYDFGCLLYNLLTGSTPPELSKIPAQRFNEEIVTLRKAFVSSQSPNEPELNIPVWLSDLIYKCLQKDPDLRFNNGVELYDFILFNNLAQPRKLPTTPTEVLQKKNKVLSFEEKTDVRPRTASRVLKQSEQTSSKAAKPKGLLIGIGVFFLILLGGLLFYTNGHNKNSDTVTVSNSASTQPPVASQTITQVKDSVIGTPEKIASLNRPESIVVHNNNLAKRPDHATTTTSEEKKVTTRHYSPDTEKATRLVHPWSPEGSTLDTHNGMKTYRVISKAFFYNRPNHRTRRRAFIVHWNNVLLKPIREQNGFIYIVFTNSLGQTSKGWLRKKDLVQAEK